MPVIICKDYKHLVGLYNIIFTKYDGHPVTFELYLQLTQEGNNVNEIYGEIFLSDQTNTQTVI